MSSTAGITPPRRSVSGPSPPISRRSSVFPGRSSSIRRVCESAPGAGGAGGGGGVRDGAVVQRLGRDAGPRRRLGPGAGRRGVAHHFGAAGLRGRGACVGDVHARGSVVGAAVVRGRRRRGRACDPGGGRRAGGRVGDRAARRGRSRAGRRVSARDEDRRGVVPRPARLRHRGVGGRAHAGGGVPASRALGGAGGPVASGAGDCRRGGARGGGARAQGARRGAVRRAARAVPLGRGAAHPGRPRHVAGQPGLPRAHVGAVRDVDVAGRVRRCERSGPEGCWLGGRWADRWGRTLVTSAAMAVSGACALGVGAVFGRSLALLVPVLLVWGVTVVADSAQFSAAVSELAPRELVGTALTLQTSLGFLLTGVTIYLVPWAASRIGWRWSMSGLALGPAAGVAAMLALRRRREAWAMAGGRR